METAESVAWWRCWHAVPGAALPTAVIKERPLLRAFHCIYRRHKHVHYSLYYIYSRRLSVLDQETPQFLAVAGEDHRGADGRDGRQD